MSRLNEDVVLELIGRLGGNVSAIARACSVDRTAVVGFIERRSHLIQALRDARAALADDARSNLARHVADGKSWAFRLALQPAPPDALDVKSEDQGPELTDEERLSLLQALVDKVKARQEKGQPNSKGATGEGAENGQKA
jgi:hypothetical protein